MKNSPQIIHEDKDLLVIDKPPGLHSVQQSKSQEASLAEWLTKEYPSLARVGKNEGESGLVQRLDFETSGLILVAKHNTIWDSLHESIMKGEIDKSYYCLVEGILEHKKIEVNSFIGSPYRRAMKVRVYPKEPGKPHRALPAKTSFEVISYFKKNEQTLLKVKAATARRHQVRAHAASIGHPLIGDNLYGSTFSLEDKYPVEFYLQASFLSFIHPTSGKKLSFELQIPEQIQELIG